MATTTNSPSGPPQEKDNPGQDEFDKIIRYEFSPAEEKSMEERAAAGAESDRDSLDKISQAEKQGESSGDTQTESPSLYRRRDSQKRSFVARLNRSQNMRRYMLFGGITASIIALIIALLGFMSVFKLDGLMSNIEERAFIRNNASLDTRSSKFINAYLEARMLQIGDDSKDNVLFRSNKVDTNSPFTDWYRTLRASNFEQDVFEKHGIKFTSVVGQDGRPRLGKIDINGEAPIDINISSADFDAIQRGDIKTLDKFSNYLNTQWYGNNKDARRAIKEVVNDNTHFFQVYKRRSLRKALQNMTGVRDWRFFENTRDKVANKRIDLRNRMLDKILPDPGNNIVSDVARCFYGLNKCSPNRDTAAPQNRADGSGGDEGANDSKDPNNPHEETATEKKLTPASLDAAGISDALKKVLVAANIYTKIVNIPSTLDMLSYVNSNISKLAKLVVIARGAQAAGLFQVFETSRDQIKSGQVDASEVNAFMENMENAASSDGWTKVVEGQGDPSVTQSGGVCSTEAQALQEKDSDEFMKKYKNDNPNYAPLCADQQIGSASNAKKIQNSYNDSVGKIVGPIASGWKSVKDAPVLGQIVGVVEWFGNLTSKITTPIVTGILSAIGLKDNLQAAISWVFAKTSNFLGVTILKGYESSGTIFNWLVQGGAYTAESASRQEGAALTTTDSKNTAQGVIAQYRQDKQVDTSFYSRVASLDNPDSLAFKGAFALSNLNSGSLFSGLQSMWSTLGKNFGLLFGKDAYAATPNGYAASEFAGIDTYDFPQQCYDLNPTTAQPIDGTNALSIFKKYNIKVSQTNLDALNSWKVEADSDSFFNTIYDIIGQDRSNADDIALQIYNCNLFDSAVMGSLGFPYGYTDSNGIND